MLGSDCPDGTYQQNQTPDVGGPWASARDGHTGQMWLARCVKTASVAESHSHAGWRLVMPLVQGKKLSLKEVKSLARSYVGTRPRAVCPAPGSPMFPPGCAYRRSLITHRGANRGQDASLLPCIAPPLPHPYPHLHP